MFLKLCKFSVAMLFINLYVIYTLTGSHIPNGTLIFGVSSGVFMVLDALTTSDYKLFGDIRPEMVTLVLFLLWAIITAPMAINASVAVNASVNFLQKLVFVFVIYYICRKDNSLNFTVVLFLSIALFAAILTVLMYGEIEKRVELSDNIGENALGNLMVLGSFCVLYLYKGNKWYSFSIVVGTIALFFFVIALTGSRKSLVALVTMIVMYVIVMPKKPISFSAKSFFSLIFLLVLAYFLFTEVAPKFYHTSLYNRLFDERVSAKANTANEFRKSLYETAWYEFKHNFLLGIGLGNFNFEHGSYTHSAYAEVLVSTGIVGTVLYFTSYVCSFVKLWKNMLDKSVVFLSLRRNRLVFCFFIVFLYIGIGIGHLYDNISMLELGMFMAAGCGLMEKERKEPEPKGVAAADAG